MTKKIDITAVDPNGQPIVGAQVSAIGQPPWQAWQLGGQTDVHGHWGFGTVALGVTPMLITISAPGFVTWSEVMPIPANSDWTYTRGLVRDSHITIAGRFFQLGGQNWRYLGVSDFNLFPQFVRGVDIGPILRQRVDLGFNVVRTFLYAGGSNVFAIDPHSYNAQRIADFLGLVNAAGLKADLTKGDAQLVLPNQADQIAHQQMVDSVILNNFNQTCNEPLDFGRKNGIDVSVVKAMAGIRSSGDYDDRTVHQNALDFIDYHGTRSGSGLAPKWVTDEVECVLDGFDEPNAPNGHYDAVLIPFIHGEPQHFGPSRGILDPRLAFLLGDKIGRWLSGGTMHTDQGITSELFTGPELACVKEFVRGMMLAPLI